MDEMISFVVLLALVALIGGATALAMDSFQDSADTSSACLKSGVDEGANCSVAYNATQAGIDGTLNVSAQLPTIGTIVGVAVLIGIVISAFAFARQ